MRSETFRCQNGRGDKKIGLRPPLLGGQTWNRLQSRLAAPIVSAVRSRHFEACRASRCKWCFYCHWVKSL